MDPIPTIRSQKTNTPLAAELDRKTEDSKLNPAANHVLNRLQTVQNPVQSTVEETTIVQEEPVFTVMPDQFDPELQQGATTVTQTETIRSATPTKTTLHESITTGNSNRKKFLLFGGLITLLLLAAGGVAFAAWSKQKKTAQPEAPQVTPIENIEPLTKTTKEWQQKYFNAENCVNLDTCGDTADPDKDGLTNFEEFNAQTDPNNPDSSGGGIADGDKVHVWGGNPLVSKSKEGQYTDADYYKYGYDLATDQPYTPDTLTAIKTKIQSYGLHDPTLKTLGAEGLKLYDFAGALPPEPEAPVSPLQNVDQSAKAQLDRDTQRQSSIQKIGAAILAYQKNKQVVPDAIDFVDLTSQIKPFNPVATNYTDPINADKYVYAYIPNPNKQDFTLTYFSETQNQLIRYGMQDVLADAKKQDAAQYDGQRMDDLEKIRNALMLYSNSNVAATSDVKYVFPTKENLKSSLVPQYLTDLPTDPKTGAAYAYEVGTRQDTFSLKATLDNPPKGTTGYLCNQLECKNY